MHRSVILAAMLGAVTAAMAVPAAQALPHQRNRERAENIGQSIDTTFRMDKGGVVDLSVTFGDIIVTGASDNNVRVRATSEGGRVRLRASATLATLRAFSERGGRDDDVRYEVSVPAGVRVVLHNTQGDLTVSGLKADLEAVNITGDIQLSDISGLAKIETVSGDIVATGLSGGARIETASGDVSITEADGELVVDNTSGSTVLTNVRSKAVRAESVSGSVRFQGAIDPAGRYDFASHSGNIRLALPPNTGALLTLSTYTGSIDSEFPITLQQSLSGNKQRELQFRLGSGSARLTAESFSGNIIITRGTGRDRQE